MAYIRDGGYLRASYAGTPRGFDTRSFDNIEGVLHVWTKPDGTLGEGIPPLWVAREADQGGYKYTVQTGFSGDGTQVVIGIYNGKSDVTEYDGNGNFKRQVIGTTTWLPMVYEDTGGVPFTNLPIFEVPFTAESNPAAWEYGQNGTLPKDTKCHFEGTLYVDGTTNALLTLDYTCPEFSDDGSLFFGRQSVAKMALHFGYEYPTHVSRGDTLENDYNDRFTMSLDDAYGHTNAAEWGQVLNKIITFGQLDNVIMWCQMSFTDPADPLRVIKSDEVKIVLANDGTEVSVTNIGGAEGDITDGVSTVTIVHAPAPSDTGTEDGTEPPEEEKSDETEAGEPTTTTLNMLTQSYSVTVQKLQSLGQVLWSQTFFDNIKLVNNNPIDNIVSVKMFPFETCGTESSIVCGNVDMGVTGQKLVNPSLLRDCGTITVPKKYSGYRAYLDYAPYTTAVLYLPFIGEIPLDVAVVMGKTLAIKYYVDYILGSAIAIVTVDNKQILSRDATIGIDIPLTASNRSQIEIGYLQAVGSAVAQTATGNFVGAGTSLLGGALQPHTYTTSGRFTPSTAVCADLQPFVRLIRSRPVIANNFSEIHGHRVSTAVTLSKCSGYTQCESVRVSGIPCTEREKDMIKSALESGVLL